MLLMFVLCCVGKLRRAKTSRGRDECVLVWTCGCTRPHTARTLHLFVVLNLDGGVIAPTTVNRQETSLWPQPGKTEIGSND